MSIKSDRKRRIKAEKQQAASAEFIKRNWSPNAAELKLPDVPECARDSVRSVLAPIVKSIPIENGNCWEIAQRLMKVANSTRVGYVEGVWGHHGHFLEHLRDECRCDVITATHAWNTVDGYIVDLLAEYKLRIPNQPQPDVWMHEPLNMYSLDEFNGCTSDGLSITGRVGMKRGTSYEEVFKSAAERLLARLGSIR